MFKLRYFKAVFCKMYLKGSSFEFVKLYRSCQVILTLLQQTPYHGSRMSDLQKDSLFVGKFLENQF